MPGQHVRYSSPFILTITCPVAYATICSIHVQRKFRAVAQCIKDAHYDPDQQSQASDQPWVAGNDVKSLSSLSVHHADKMSVAAIHTWMQSSTGRPQCGV